jgi:hypothetical protein
MPPSGHCYLVVSQAPRTKAYPSLNESEVDLAGQLVDQ